MKFKIVMLTSLLFIGCQEVDTEALKKMNASHTTAEKSFSYDTKSTPKEEKVTKAVSTKEQETVTQSAPEKEEIVPPKQTPIVVKEESVEVVQVVEPKEDKADTPPKEALATDDKSKLPYALIAQNLEKESAQKYALELKKMAQKKEEIDQNNEFALALAKLENQQKIILKSKDLQINKSKVDADVAMAEIELKKVKESEKTSQIARTQEHQEKLLENRSTLELSKKEIELVKILIAVLGFLFLLYLIISYYTKKKSSDEKIQINQDQLKQQVQLKMIEQHGDNLHKMLEIVTSKELTPAVEKELLVAIKESHKKTPILNEKQKKGLIFR